ncbi:hypothetical protein KA183_07240 [bacterium]|nr:hypothetical protein [bacterium]
MLTPNSHPKDSKGLPFEQRALHFVGTSGSWYTFQARLLPEHPGVDLGSPAYAFSETSAKYASEIFVLQSKIRIRIFTDERDFGTLKNNMISHVQFLVDSFGLFEGFWFTVNLQSVTLPDGGFLTFDTIYRNLTPAPETQGLKFQEILALEEACLITATSDFRNAMQSPIDSGLYCYRAVESIMQTFKTSPGEDEKKVWSRMNTALQIDKSFTLTKIKPFADPRRHGESNFSITGPERDECLSATRQIIMRFCHYLKQGKTSIDSTVYPILKA